MLKKLFFITYSNNLILEMLEAKKVSILASYISAPLLIIIALYNHIPNSILTIWFSINILILISRLLFAKKLEQSLESNIYYKNNFFNIYIFIIAISGLQFGSISLIAAFYNVPDISFFVITIVIIGLTSGSITTLGTVFIAFVSYVLFASVPLIMALLYHASLPFYELAFILTFFIVFHIQSGHRLFLTYKRNAELESKFKTLYDKSSDGIAIIKNNQIIECNDALINMFGYTENKNSFFETAIFNLSPLKQQENKSSTKEMLKMLKKAKENLVIFEWLHVRKDGSEFWVEITLNTIDINNENIIHGVWRIIDSRKKFEKEVKDLNDTLISRVDYEVEKNKQHQALMAHQNRLAQMGEMIGMIAHQWRQPLNNLSLLTQSISLKYSLGKLDDNLIDIFNTKTNLHISQMSNTIDDFRDFFKPENEKSLFNISKQVLHVINILEYNIKNENIKLDVNIDENISIKGYPNEFGQVILNIINNAKDALVECSVKNKIIKIYTKIVDGKILLYIEDNANGIDEKIIDKIFDPYFSTKDEKNGTGLGLYMSKIIIQDHMQGSIKVENTNNGARFILEFSRS